MWDWLSATAPPHGAQSTKHCLCCGGALGFECGDGRSFWEAVERHVDEGGVASGRCGARGGAEAFPFGAAGFVDVDVRVDEAGEDGVMSVIVAVASSGTSERLQMARIFSPSMRSAPARVPSGVTMRFERKACDII